MKTITTTIKWHNAAEELPERTCSVVVLIHSSDYCATLNYSAKHKLFNALDFEPPRIAVTRAIEVSHWCYKEELRRRYSRKKRKEKAAMTNEEVIKRWLGAQTQTEIL